MVKGGQPGAHDSGRAYPGGLSENSYAARIYGDEFAIFCRAGAYEEKNLKKLLKDISLAVEKDIYHI